MQVGRNSPITQSLVNVGGPSDRKVSLDLSAHGLSEITSVPAGNEAAIQEILRDHFAGIDLNNLTAPLTYDQAAKVYDLNRLGALDVHTQNAILDQSDALESPAHPAAGSGEGLGRISPAQSGSSNVSAAADDEAHDLAERGESPRAASVRERAVNEDAQTTSGPGFFGSLSAAGRAIGNALPRATPAVLDTVCLGLSLPIAVLAIKQAVEESGNTSHDSTKLFMKATLPTVVAMNSLRNIIKYGTDGRRV